MAFAGPAGPAEAHDEDVTSEEDASNIDGLEPGTQIRMVNKFVFHPLANSAQGFTAADVAMVELEEPLELNRFVRSVCLAEEDPEEGMECVTAGWTDADQGGKQINIA